ncbi:receptor-like protein 56 [Telopea speciosissima]|uniref:receptor-like protein 56 n=1 Tax=Telopea speciosissima TaxID=54955 RepID=UPI001CC550E8|nr:receptor-like protein 56 [Telopea speciosissima]
MKNLQQLNLSRNNFEGFLSPCLQNLTSLTTLFLSHNQFRGNIPSSLITSLTSLEHISLSYNDFEGTFTFNTFANNSKLESIELQSAGEKLEVEADYPHWIPPFQLRALLLSNCKLNKNTNSIPGFLSNQYNLALIDLSNNNLMGMFPTWLLENNKMLEGLILRNNSLRGHFHLSFYMHRAVAVDISNNYIDGHLEANIGKMLPNIQYLNLSYNYFKGGIPPSIGEMKQLESLDLSYNNFSGEIPYNMAVGCFNLFFLRLSYNSLIYLHLDGNEFTWLPSVEFVNNSNLQTLDIGDNNLYGSIPYWIGELSNLRILLVEQNHLGGKVPENLCQLAGISLMDLSHNRLSGPIPRCLNNITFGRIRGTQAPYSGYYPISEFYFHSNLNLDEDFVSWEYYAVNEVFITKSRSNSYQGKILQIMFGLDLSCNNLIGEIPYEIGDFNEIRSLNLSHNQLTGSIPVTFSNLTQVESLDLSYNNLSGEIPSQLVTLNTLAVFSVAHNNLSGRTPDMKGQFSTFSATSYEGNPFLCGPPLPRTCSASGVQSTSTPTATSNGVEKEDDIDMNIFIVVHIHFMCKMDTGCPG